VARNTIGKLSVQLTANTAPFRAGMGRAQRILGATTRMAASAATSLARVASVAAVGGGIALAGLASSSIAAARDAEETMSRFAAVFGDEAEKAGGYADELASRVGRNAVEIRDNLSSFQGFFLGLGFGSDKARELSTQMQGLSIDFASFNNLSDQEGAERFISALSGSSEVLARFGVNIKQAAIEQELINQGIADSVVNATEQEKALARVAIIYRSLGSQGAVGDAERTAASYANQTRRLGANMSALRVEIGRELLPVAKALVTQLNSGFEFLITNMDSLRKAAGIFAENIGEYISESLGGIDELIEATRTLKRELESDTIARRTSDLFKGPVDYLVKSYDEGPERERNAPFARFLRRFKLGVDVVQRGIGIETIDRSNLQGSFDGIRSRFERSVLDNINTPDPPANADNQRETNRKIDKLIRSTDETNEILRDSLSNLSEGSANPQLLRVFDRIAVALAGRGGQADAGIPASFVGFDLSEGNFG
jgi:hypothetical protein